MKKEIVEELSLGGFFPTREGARDFAFAVADEKVVLMGVLLKGAKDPVCYGVITKGMAQSWLEVLS